MKSFWRYTMVYLRLFGRLKSEISGAVSGDGHSRRHAALGAAIGLGLKVTGSVLAIVMFTLAARLMQPERFGQFAMIFNLTSFAAVVATMGQEALITRSWSEYRAQNAAGLAKGAYRFGSRMVTSAALICALLFFLAWKLDWLNVSFFGLAAILTFLISQALLHYSSTATRMISGFIVSETSREIIWRLTVILAFGIWALFGWPVSASLFFVAATLGMLASLIFQLRSVRLDRPHDIKNVEADYDIGEWLMRVKGMWPSAILEAASQYVDVIIIGLLVSPTLAGGYFVAMRIANVFSMIASGMNNYTSARIGTLYYSGQKPQLQKLLNGLNGIALVLIALIFAILILYGRDVLGLFGESYRQDYAVLLVLAASVAFAVLSGPVAALLLTTGHERLYSRAVFFSLLGRIGLFLLLVKLFGAIGAAVSWSLASLPLSVILVWICRRDTRIDPSLLGVFRKFAD